MLTRLRRRSSVIAIAVTVVLVLVAVGVGNVVIKHVAEGRIARLAGCQLSAGGPVGDSLPGTFAGLGAVFGDVGDVHVWADGVQRDGVTAHVDAVLHDVTTGGSTSGGTAVASAPYSAMTQQLVQMSGLTDPSMAPDGAGLVITGSRSGIPVTVHTSISSSADGFTITPTTVVVFGKEMSVASLRSLLLVKDLARQLDPKVFALPGLPDGAALTAVRPGPSGLSLDFSIPKRGASKAETTCHAAAG
ncbi:hypothetical protein [Catenulispora pinisilvae]|uniref:hypothetical protein n=1 Tax=Catenulispora pinisilvae TaxID=2705253 RepID=UPI001891762E|nr:hypothetical protein [Catenulispora pinisilvae]